MKILIGTNHLGSYGGSESHCFALIIELQRQGHDVELMVYQKNILPVYLDRTGLTANKFSGNWDAVLLSHNTTVSKFFQLYPDFNPDRVVQTVHGLIPSIEKPYSEQIQIVTISEEIANEYQEYSPTVILNGIDLERFSVGKPVNDEIQSVFSMSQSAPFNGMLAKLCEGRGWAFRWRNKNENPIFDVQDEMKSADLVVAIGRSCYEAMSCGRVVLVADHRPYQEAIRDQIIDLSSYLISRKRNCSGRSFGHSVTSESILTEIDDYYNPEAGLIARHLAELHHDIRKTTSQYLEML